MATFHATSIGTMNVQVRIGGDMALLRGVAKALFEASADDPAVLDQAFIEAYTIGLEEYRALVEATSWSEIVAGSGVEEVQIRALADSYAGAGKTIIAWCLGLTQHEHGVATIREVVNVLLLRGNIGREGAGPSPIRGLSNVQGNRTFGIDHRPTEQFLRRLGEVCKFEPPREHGHGLVKDDPRDARPSHQGVRQPRRQCRSRRSRYFVHVRGATAV
jgi:anaerobic selenocysteine-containing dehydrogenase